MRAGLLTLVLIAACRGPKAEIFCGRVAMGEPGQGLNPLIRSTHQICWDSSRACDERSRGGCDAIAEPRWHCIVLGGPSNPNDPMNGSTMCWPSLATCLDSQPPGSSACSPTPSVYCASQNHVLVCTATEADCDLNRGLAASALHLESGPCVQKGAGP